jgi:hypothetical protein
MRRVHGLLKLFTAAALCATWGAACGSSPHETPSVSSFCVSADEVFNKGTFTSDGVGVVESLRGLHLEALVDADRESISTAIGVVEANIASFHSGNSPGGWSTEPVATLAARICSDHMQSFFVLP